MIETIAVALTLAGLVKALSDLLLQPITRRFPEQDLWWWDYVAFAGGAAVGWVAGINLLATLVSDPLVGRILTALVVGGGAPLINQLFGSIQGRTPDGVIFEESSEESAAGSGAKRLYYTYRGW